MNFHRRAASAHRELNYNAADTRPIIRPRPNSRAHSARRMRRRMIVSL